MKPFFVSLSVVLALLLSTPSQADNVLEHIQATIKEAPLLRGEFVQQKTLQGISKTLNSEGYFIVDKANSRLLWVTTKPFHHLLRVSKEEILQKGADGRLLMRLDAQKEANVASISQLLFALFSSDSTTLTQFFRYTGQIKENKWHLELNPIHTGLAQVIRHISLDGAQAVQNIKLDMKTGDITRITFTKVTPLTTLSADEIAAFK